MCAKLAPPAMPHFGLLCKEHRFHWGGGGGGEGGGGNMNSKRHLLSILSGQLVISWSNILDGVSSTIVNAAKWIYVHTYTYICTCNMNIHMYVQVWRKLMHV